MQNAVAQSEPRAITSIGEKVNPFRSILLMGEQCEMLPLQRRRTICRLTSAYSVKELVNKMFLECVNF